MQIVMENPNHLNEPNEAIPEVNPVVPEPNQVVDIHDPNEMVDIPDDIDLVDYDEEDPEEDPEEEPEEDVKIDLDDDAELIFPYEVEGGKTSPPGDIALLSPVKIGEKERELLNHDLENVERALGNVLERMSVLESGENATLKKRLAETETNRILWLEFMATMNREAGGNEAGGVRAGGGGAGGGGAGGGGAGGAGLLICKSDEQQEEQGEERKLKQVDTTVLSDEEVDEVNIVADGIFEDDQGSRPKKQRKKSKKLDIQVIVNEEAEENEESEKYEDKSLQKKKRKGKKAEFVENEMVEDEMVESDKAEEPPIRKKKLDAPYFVDVRKLKGDMLVLKGAETVSKKAFVGDKRKKDNVEAKKETVKKKVVAAERQVSVKKGKQKINEGSLVSFKEGKKDKDEGVLMVVEKGKEVVLNEKVKRDPVNILTRMSPSHLKNVLDSLTTQQVSVLEELGLGEYHNNFNFTSTPGKLGLWIVKNYDHEEHTIKMVDARKIKVTRELIHEILGVPMGEIKVNALLNTTSEDETTTDWRRSTEFTEERINISKLDNHLKGTKTGL
ncbi:hypothetical protein Tco_0608405 [Tanacetum coccineum]